MSVHLLLNENSITVTDMTHPICRIDELDFYPGAKLLIMLDRLPWDLPDSRGLFLDRLTKLKTAPVLKVLIEVMSIFSGPLLITSYMRGTGTHTGAALDFKPVLSLDAHKMGLSPMYNSRSDLIKSLMAYNDFIVLKNVVLLVEENHIHIHVVTKNLESLLAPGIYVKPVYSKRYNNDDVTDDMISMIEGRTGGKIISGSEFIKLFGSVPFLHRF